MSEEKQIEEMAEVYDKARLMACETLGSMNEGAAMWYSKAFYEAGYRKQSDGDGLLLTFDGATGYFPKEFIIEAIKTHMKQSEGEWEQVGDDCFDLCFRCSNCREEFSCEVDMPIFAKFCPNCGAKMKGGAE